MSKDWYMQSWERLFEEAYNDAENEGYTSEQCDNIATKYADQFAYDDMVDRVAEYGDYLYEQHKDKLREMRDD